MLASDFDIKIAEAVSTRERERAYRFRYELYVEQMKRLQYYADHDSKQISEPLDQSGHVLCAYDSDDHLIGTVRYNVGVDENFGIYTSLYRLQEFGPFFPKHVSITTKLMVASRYRQTGVASQLAAACYTSGLKLGACFNVIDCNPHLVQFFEQLGYRQAGAVHHPEFGNVMLMVLAVHDVEHFEKVGSPLAALGREFEDKLRSVEFFRNSAFAHAA